MNPSELLRAFTFANEFKEGDLLLGGTRDEQVRAEARQQICALRLGEIGKAALVEDGVSDALARALNSQLEKQIAHLTVAELKRILLSADGPQWVRRYRDGLASEVIAAVVKVMSDDELSTVARSLFNPLPGPQAPEETLALYFRFDETGGATTKNYAAGNVAGLPDAGTISGATFATSDAPASIPNF